jgi:Flp pilus assembly protein protease CpaA
MTIQAGIALLLLFAAVVDDLKTKKIHNVLVIACAVIALAFLGLKSGPASYVTALISLTTAVIAILPLYLTKILGGGDLKFFAAVSLLLSWQGVLVTLLTSVIWGSVLGVLMVVMKGQGKAFAANLVSLAHRVKPEANQLHKVPYSVALLFGYMTHLILSGGAA